MNMLLGNIQRIWFWLAFVLIVIGAAVPRLLIYDFSLPYIDHPDEGTSFLEARHWRGEYELGGGHPGYPPGYIAVNYLVQAGVEGIGGGNLENSMVVLRLLAVIFNLGTLVTVALTARLIAGDVAGIIAGVMWGVSPMVVTNGILALPDPFLYFLVSLAGLLAAFALTDESRRVWCIWSVAAGLAAVAVKYQAIPALLPGGIIALSMLRTDRQRAVRYLALQAVMVAVVGLWLVFGYDALRSFGTNRETVELSENGLTNLFSPGRFWVNFQATLWPFGTWITFAALTLGLAAYVLARRTNRPTVRGDIALLLIVTIVAWVWLVGSFSLVNVPERIRHVMPASAWVAALVGAALAQIALWVPSRTAGYVAVLFAMTGLTWGPQIHTLTREIPVYRLPDRRVEIRQWADLNLEAGTVVVDQSNHKTFNPFWGGIQGRQWFDWWVTDSMTEFSVTEWRDERGMSYMAMPVGQWQAMQTTEDGAAFLDQLYLLRDFTAPPTMRGPQIRFYRLWGPQSEVNVAFGEHIRLVGYDLPESWTPGEPAALRLYWQADEPPPTNYNVYIHLTAPDSREVLAQLDAAPAAPERLTVTWTDPTETLISPPMPLNMPPDLPAGRYRVLVGLYNFETFERLPTQTPLGDGFEIATFEVE